MQAKTFKLIAILAITSLIWLLDFKIGGTEVSFSVLYLIPICLATWYINPLTGFLIAVLSLLTRGWIDFSRLPLYSNPLIPLDNTVIRAACFLGAVYALSRIRVLVERERRFGTIDFLTGIPNSRSFYDHANREGNRCRRYGKPLTVAFMDCDNFKEVNDRWGHKEGDDILRVIARTLQSQVRSSDFVARLGGDEFGFLLPDTDGDTALEVITRAHESLLKSMKTRNCSVTFSIGAVTFSNPPESADVMVAQADTLMYSVKSQSKNKIKVEVV